MEIKISTTYKALVKTARSINRDGFKLCRLVHDLAKDYKAMDIATALCEDVDDTYNKSTISRMDLVGSFCASDGTLELPLNFKASWSTVYEIVNKYNKLLKIDTDVAKVFIDEMTSTIQVPTRDYIRGWGEKKPAETNEPATKSKKVSQCETSKTKAEVIVDIKSLMAEYGITVEDLA